MIVISSPNAIKKEIEIIQNLFQEGMNRFHIRKPDLSKNELEDFIDAIGLEYHDKIVLHNFSLKNSSVLNCHISDWKSVDFNLFQDKMISTSTHSIDEFNQLTKNWNYAFLSPVFESISKENYGRNSNVLETVQNRTNFQTELVALGGIQEDTIKLAFDSGFDNVALLGAIWLEDNPIQKFKKCQKIVHSY